MRFCVVFMILICCVQTADAAFSHPVTSPSRAAVGETLAGDLTAGAMVLNPAAFAMTHKMCAELAGQRLYGAPELDAYLGTATYRFGRFGGGVSFESIGDGDFYLESTIGVHAGCRLAPGLFTGISANIDRIDIVEPYSDQSSFSSCFGVIAMPFDDWFVYSSIRNPFESKIAGGTRYRREFTAGVSIVGVDDVSFAMEMESIRGRNLRYKIGEEYRVTKAFSLSGGIMTSPFVPSFGFRLAVGEFSLLYAYRYHPELGGTHLWGIAFSR